MKTFIGRAYELSLLGETLNKASASVIIYGKRKVGKTTLILQSLKNSSDPVIYYECLKSSLADNIFCFVSQLVRQQVLPMQPEFRTFSDVFAYLDSLGRTLNIVIDEYPYLKEMTDPAIVDSQFQKIIDNYLSHIRLFLSGSHIGMMKDMLAEKNALYGRFSLMVPLTELDYQEAADFYPLKSVRDKIAFYAVFGGSPFVNSFLQPDEDLRTNIINTVLNPNNPVSTYVSQLLISDYAKTMNAERIFHAIANGRKRYGDIEEMLGMKSNGLLSKQLSSMLNMEILSKYYPINKKDDKKKAAYELNDNLLRFYYAFVYRNRSALTVLGAEAFYDEYINKALSTFIAHRFEEMCRNYFSICVKKGKIKGVADIGTYYYDDSETHTNGEFDVALKRHEEYDIYEVKNYVLPLSAELMEQEAEKIRRIKGLPIKNIGFISSSGFEENTAPYIQICGRELYDNA